MGSYTERAIETMARYRTAAQELSDAKAATVPELFAHWSGEGIGYQTGGRVQYNGLLYKCLTAHTSQESWTPDESPSLWVRIDDPAIEWPEIRNPIPAENPYMQGDKCQKNGIKYISLIDNNVWQPEDYPQGWQVVDG
jgi:hypothetical protein